MSDKDTEHLASIDQSLKLIAAYLHRLATLKETYVGAYVTGVPPLPSLPLPPLENRDGTRHSGNGR